MICSGIADNSMFDTLGYKYGTLGYKFDTLGYKFDTLEHRFNRQKKTFTVVERFELTTINIIFNYPKTTDYH